MNYLSEEAEENRVESILFLTPCHATPYYSTLHRNISMRFLDCTPRYNTEFIVTKSLTYNHTMQIFTFFQFFLHSDEKGTLDESDQFLQDPFNFATNFAKKWNRPSHIVVFDSQEKLLKEFLASQHFKEVWHFYKFYYLCLFRCSKTLGVWQTNWIHDLQIRRFFHSHFKVDRELQASVAVYAFKGHWIVMNLEGISGTDSSTPISVLQEFLDLIPLFFWFFTYSL